MDPLRTLLLARTHVVVLDPDLAAGAATRPSRTADLDKLEDELAQLGFVMSLDLAMTIRRLPHQTIDELRSWLLATLSATLGARRPDVPLAAGDGRTALLRRMLTWLASSSEHPCPWCAQARAVNAIDPCGHLVCSGCWSATNFGACPICVRRTPLDGPFAKTEVGGPRVTGHAGRLALLQLAFDLQGAARARFQELLARATPLPPDERAELDTVIDARGPLAVDWLPPRIPVRETAAHVIARLWAIAPDRTVIARDTADHVRTADDLLRVACVLAGGNAALVEPMQLRSLPRALRRALLASLERLPLEPTLEAMMRRRRLWQRVGERLHPFEHAANLPNAALAFACVRGTAVDPPATPELAAIRAHAVTLPYIKLHRGRAQPIAWAAPIEHALRNHNPRSALGRLTHRPVELLRRADHLVRLAQAHQLDAFDTVLTGVKLAAAKAPPETLIALAANAMRRGRRWPRRVFFPGGSLFDAWAQPDHRSPLRGDAIGAMVGSMRFELVKRAETLRPFPRAVIDRALGDLLVPARERAGASPRLVWPRGSELGLPAGTELRVLLGWKDPPGGRIDLDLALVFFDQDWRHVATCDVTNLVVGADTRAAVHTGDTPHAPPPRGAFEAVDLRLEPLHALGARHAMMVVYGGAALPLERLPRAFATIVPRPADGTAPDLRAATQRFDLRGRSAIQVPLAIDLAERRVRWLDAHVPRGEGLSRERLAHLGRDLADRGALHARTTLWDVACVHAAARANLVYVRERDGTITAYRRRDGERGFARLHRLLSGAADDGKLAAIPPVDAPTWLAVLAADLPVAKDSAGYVLDSRTVPGDGFERATATELVTSLASVTRAS